MFHDDHETFIKFFILKVKCMINPIIFLQGIKDVISFIGLTPGGRGRIVSNSFAYNTIDFENYDSKPNSFFDISALSYMYSRGSIVGLDR